MKRWLAAALALAAGLLSQGLMLGPNLGPGLPPDTAGPNIFGANDDETGTTTGTAYFASDTADGTAYWYVSTSGTPPSAVNLKACAPSPADCGNATVVASGIQGPFTFDGLTPSTLYRVHFLHTDAAGNDSPIITSTGFTTTGSPCTLGATVADNATIVLGDGNSYRAQNSNELHSLQRWTCNNGLRFEVQPGDKPSFDAADVERSELYSLQTYPQGAEFWCSWAQREVNALPTSTFITSPQGHHSGSSGNPPWSLNYTGSKVWHVYHRFSTPGVTSGTSAGPSGTQADDYNGGLNFLADNAWHRFVVRLRFNSPGTAPGTGINVIYLDGNPTPIVNLTATNMGFHLQGSPYYMKLGIYRGSSSGISKKDIANWECSTSSLFSRVANPLTISIP
jgi:hypothetical protein